MGIRSNGAEKNVPDDQAKLKEWGMHFPELRSADSPSFSRVFDPENRLK